MKLNLYFYSVDICLERTKRKTLKELFLEYKKDLIDFICKTFPKSEQLWLRGTNSFNWSDERTKRERFNDNIRMFLLNFIEGNQNHYTTRRKARSVAGKAFASWFDVGIGKKVSSTYDIQKLEKEGQVFLTDSEIESETARYRRYKKEEQRKASDKAWDDIVRRQKEGEFKTPRYVDRVDASYAMRGEQ